MPGILFVVFLVLKLTGEISWSWWWVTCPLWAGLLIAMLAGLVMLLMHIAVIVYYDIKKRRR